MRDSIPPGGLDTKLQRARNTTAYHGGISSGVAASFLDSECLLRSRLVAMIKKMSEIQRVRLFNSQRLERLSYITAREFMWGWALIVPGLVWLAWGTVDVHEAVLLALAGMIAWFFFEYVMHRFLFHWETKMPFFQPMIFVVHGNHHIEPKDPLRGLMPFIVSLPAAGMLWLLFRSVLGPDGGWMHLGFILGYITYDLTHYACHQWSMKGALGQAVKKHHMRHHYVDPTGNFAVTAVFIDRLFGSHITSTRRGPNAVINQEP